MGIISAETPLKRIRAEVSLEQFHWDSYVACLPHISWCLVKSLFLKSPDCVLQLSNITMPHFKCLETASL